MALRLETVAPADFESLVPVLSEADENDDRIRAEIRLPGRAAYRGRVGDEVVGAATMRWEHDEGEIVHIAVLPQRRGQGLGKAIVEALLAVAAERGVASVVVGTANSSLDNIAFYQHCGFRMDHVRRDYFDYLDEPVIEQGIPMRDMLVFRRTSRSASEAAPRSPRSNASPH